MRVTLLELRPVLAGMPTLRETILYTVPALRGGVTGHTSMKYKTQCLVFHRLRLSGTMTTWVNALRDQ